MTSFKTVVAATALVVVWVIGIADASAQQGDLRECLRRLESAVSERERLFRQIDERTLNQSDRDYVGSQKITSYSMSIDGRMDVERNLEDCRDAAANHEWANERLRDIAAESAATEGAYESCVDELRHAAEQYNQQCQGNYRVRRYNGIEDCEAVREQVIGWLRDAEAQGRCN